jgi:hypothetical protein
MTGPVRDRPNSGLDCFTEWETPHGYCWRYTHSDDEQKDRLTAAITVVRTLAIPKAAEPWSLTSLREKLIKIGAKVGSHGRYVTFQMAEVAVSRQMRRVKHLFAQALMPGRAMPAAGRSVTGCQRTGTRRDLWLPVPLKRCNFCLQTGRYQAKIGLEQPRIFSVGRLHLFWLSALHRAAFWTRLSSV